MGRRSKRPNAKFALWLVYGAGAGLVLSLALDKAIAVWVAVGAGVGLLIGTILDRRGRNDDAVH